MLRILCTRAHAIPCDMLINVFQVRGFLLNFGVYYATRAALGLTFEWRSVDSLGFCCKGTPLPS